MPQQPFTPAGVQAKQTELNALSQQALTAQANLIKSDLRSWVTNNFTLDSTQQTYLAQIDDQWIGLAAAVTGFAVQNKLTVTLTVSGSESGFKLIRFFNDISTTTSSNGLNNSGGVTFAVSYQ